MTRTVIAGVGMRGSFAAVLAMPVIVALPGAACSDRVVGPGSNTPLPPPEVVLTGTVYQHTAAGRTTVAEVRVSAVDLLEGPYNWMPWFETTTDAGGRFAIWLNTAFVGRRLIVTARAGSHLTQVCGTNPTVSLGTASVEIDLVAPGSAERPCGAPSVQGVVTVNSPQGPRPAADVPVGYSSNGHDGADAYTRTDADGRYWLGGLPAGRGYVYVGCASVVTVDLEVHNETVANIDVGSAAPACP